MVETLAHYRAARAFDPDVTFILDIGGQDMKAIFVKEGQIQNIKSTRLAHRAAAHSFSRFRATWVTRGGFCAAGLYSRITLQPGHAPYGVHELTS